MTRPDGAAPQQQRPWPLLVVVAGVALGLAVGLLADSTWRLGCLLIGVSLLVGAVERLVLPDRAAGLLGVRTKGFDAAVLVLAGAAVVALTLLVPPGR